MGIPAIRGAFLSLAMSGSRWLQLVVFIPTFVSLVLLRLGLKERYPANYALLLVLTLCISLDVGYICAVLYAQGLGQLVLQALTMTVVLFSGLTLWTFCSGSDFSFLGGFLLVALGVLTVTGLLGFLFPGLVNNLVYSFGGALIFCGYIVFDTWRVSEKFGYDDYIVAAIELYLDVVNLFLYILDILIKLQSKAEKKRK
jgi:hypothetical protein